jgi:hypothetical protein
MFKGKGERRFAGEFPIVRTAELHCYPCSVCGGQGAHDGVGHAYTTQRFVATQDMSEEALTREIDAATDRLTVLYAARRGKRLEVPGNADAWSWCSGCGKAQLEGRQLCNTCAALL